MLAAAGKRDREALARIYLAYKDSLFTVAVYVLGDRAAAEDVVHDVFVSLARRARRLRSRGRLKEYLLASCVNRARDLLRRRQRERRAMRAADPPTTTVTPDRQAQEADETARVVEALASLSPEQREVVALRIHGQQKFREIAELLGIPPSTAKSRYRYALDALRAVFAEKRAQS